MKRLSLGEEVYLQRLRALTHPPPCVWIRGHWDEHLPAVAIVGARAARRTSERQAHVLAETLARQGIAVVSGGAMGIDTAAHEGALAGQGATCAVLGTGVDVAYPLRNKTMFARIEQHEGALLSSFAPGTLARSWHFPVRNDLIAALSDAVVLIDSPPTSGSRYTARAAKRMGKPVFVLAGATEAGDLLQHGVHAIRSPEDILSQLSVQHKSSALHMAPPLSLFSEAGPLLPTLSTEALHLLSFVTEHPQELTELGLQAQVPLSLCAGALLELELHALCTRLPGEKYVRWVA